MPLQSSGIIVVEKPKTAVTTQAGSVAATTGVVAATTNLATQQTQSQFFQTKPTATAKAATTVGKYFEYYGANDVRKSQQQQQQQHQKQLQQHNVASSNSNSSSSSSRSQTQLPLMRRAVQRSSSNSNNTINKCNNNTITTTTTNTKIKHINVKQQQQQQQQQTQSIQMNQQQHQLIQHTTIHQQHQQQQQQIHQQQSSQQLATQLHTSQPKQQQQQHVQKQHQLSQQMHTTQQQKSQQQTQPQQQQVIQVSEEFIEQATASGATNMMISTTTGEVLNPQIFKIVATDGTTGNMIIDGGSATAVGGGQSKVLLSNLTVLAKPTPNTTGATTTSAVNVGAGGGLTAQQQQQHTISVSSGGQAQQAQTINYMSTKNLSYLTTAAAAATPITTGGSKTQKYTVTGTYKTGVKQQSQQLTSTTYIQQPQQQVGQNAVQGTQQTQQLYQKLSVPRHVQMVTRVQTVVQQPTAAGTSMTANTGQQQSQQQQQQHTQMLVQPVVGGQKYLSSSATTKSVNVTGTGGNMLKKSNSLKVAHGGGKVLNSLQIQHSPGVKTTYITQQQQQQQQQYQLHQPQYQSGAAGAKVKTSKLLKQYNNVGSGGVNMLQQQSLGTYTISNSGGGHKLQPTTTKVTKMANSKYATHQQQLQHVTTLPQGTHLHHKTLPQQQQQHQFTTGNNNVVTLATSGGNNGNSATVNVANNAGNTIKFVNSAHATVIQQHQTQTLPMQQQQTKVTLRQHPQQQQQQLQFVDAPSTTNIAKDNSGSNAIYQQQQQVQAGNNNSNTAAQSLLNDDIMFVNGTPMTDEVSARILQSMAQKSFSNQQRYQQQQQTKVAAMPPPAQQQQQQQQIVLQHTSPTSVLLSPKEYPLYSGNQLTSQQQHGAQQQQLSATPTISTQYTNAVHQTPVSATTGPAYLPTAAAANGNAVYATIPATGSSIGRQTHSAPGSRAQSLDRNKSYEASTTIIRKSAGDYYKSNSNSSGGASGRGHHHGGAHGAHVGTALSASTSNIPLETQQQQQHSSSAQIIHLQTLKTSLAANNNATLSSGNSSYTIATNNAAHPNAVTADDEDIIGEEVRPTPVNTQDLRLRILHAVQQDHTYANAMPTHLSGAESAKGSVGGVNAQAVAGGTHMQMGKAGATANSTIHSGATTQSHLQTALASNSVGGAQQWSLGGIGATVAAAAGQTGLSNMLPTPPSSGQSSYTLHGQQIPRMQQDDDAHSAISNGSRVATGDIDPGEETETAPEAEAEDDSVTRCICDLTHDDGYMICCDKCSVWQHVDCMGIDRQNIPDEYQCEVCQPRPVDKARARSLQLMKRKEQTQLLLSAQSAHATGSTGAYLGGASGAANLSGANYQLPDGQQRHLVGSNANSFLLGSGSEGNIHGLPNNTPLGTTKKGKVLKKTAKDAASGKKSKKADKLAALGGKPPRKDSTGTKKTTKRKTKSGDGLSASATAAEKHAANLRQWIENYELAVTNHYSPELRARLHAITKQPSLLQSILNTENRALKEYCNNGLENRGTTVPHAGGKILISNMDIAPSCPIFELRGKYMLSPQYKTQNASVNMNSPPPSNFLAATLKAHKTPGPFIFFYQLPDAEAPMQTMNQDGSYPPLPPQPAYLKGPEICVDTRTYGNEARFVRRSCRPNAEIQHLFEKGTIHLFIVATTRIRASTEITIKHEPHDLLAIENKKTTASNCIVQPTSTACACGLLKDCLFGPPPTQQSLGAGGATKSSSRKSSLSTTLNGGVQLNSSAAAMQLTMGGLPAGSNKKKSAAQNINRNRSTSSSGDSSIGATVAPGMNSPSIALPPAQLNMNAANALSNSTYKRNGGLNILSTHALAASAAVPNSNGNMSATSSVSSVMHDSGICTSSSSPSVSIPSPTTLHMHSPTPQTQSQQPQQQPQQQQQPVPTAAGVQRGSNGALFVQHSPQQQQQHQQILGALPTPLLLSPSQQLSQLPQQQQQPQAVVANSTSAPLLQEVTSAETATPTALTPVSGQTQPQTNLLTQQTQQEQQVLHSELAGPTISDASLAAAAALQSLNTAVTLTSSCAPLVSSVAINNNNNVVVVTPEIATPSVVDTADVDQQQPQQQQQTQFYVATEMQSAQQQDIVDGVSMQAATLQQQQQTQTLTTVELPPPSQTHAPLGAVSPNAGPKSPQKHSNNATNAAYVSANSARSHKIPGAKSSSSRSTSFSEDDHQQQQHNASSGSLNDDTVVTPTSKEKPKLSREDRKMEAILRAIEKMERNQQRKNQTKSGGGSASSGATKRRNSNSNSPTTPTKRSMGELSSSSGRVSAANARKKKRKAHKSYSGHSAQARKRRKSRMNSSNESADGAGHSNINVHSEAESTSLLSPAAPLVPTASIYHAEHNDTAVTTNEDQAAGLLLAFANPNLKMSPTPQQSPQAVASPTAQQQQQQYAPHYALEQLKSPQHRAATSVGNGASPPATPVSSACLLIEAAVGPLQEHMDGASPSGEFKYPNKTKTKKVLMSNWLLNQVDADNSGSDSPPPAAPTPPPPSVMNSSGADAVVPQETALPSGAMLGLDSLVQAATMCDYRKQHNEADSASYMPNETHCGAPMSVDEPENLSMAAQKVEEFIQQTERGNSGVYNAATNAGAPQGTSRSLLHLPLQVSTCSNNSSVKKRWLRQAISEETTTDESMTPTSTAAAMAAGLQHAASPTTAAAAAAQLNAVLNVPNGFTTPLKKRRLIISGDMKEEEDVGGSSAASPAPGVNNLFESPVIGLVKAEPQTKAPSAEHGSPSESMLTTATSSDAEVDVLNVNSSEAPRTCIKNEAETSDEEEIDEEEDDAEEERDDVDVVGGVGVNELQTSAATTTIAHVTNKCLKQEVSTKEELLLEESEQQQPAADELKTEAMLIDQDDDVDILRSPSPGHQQMLAAEDNLVKIEPEDTSGGDDVKIDVEREESLAGDKFEEMVLMQVKKEESTSEVTERLVTNNTHTDEAKVNVAEAEKLIKPDLIEENATAADEKPYKQLFNALECVEKVESPKKEEQTATSTASKPKVETQPTSNTVETVHHSAVDEERISTTPTKTSPLKLLSLDGSSLISPDEPLKKRLKLETSTVETSSTSMEVQQTSLLKPLSARIHEMPKQSENNDIVPPTTTAATTAPIALAKPTAALKVENAANNASATAAAQPNCMTFLAAAAAAAIERKPPPPPPVTTATTPIATLSVATTASAPANTHSTQSIAAVAPTVNAINSEVASGNVSVNNMTAPLPNSGNVSTALAPRKQNATNNNNSNERKAPLTDDDIQARLHSFHKENILFLQSRNNKKSKPNVTTATTTIGGGNTNELVGKSAKLSENKTSATTNYTSHHSHHHPHAHNDTVKSVGSSSNKHSSTTKSFGNSSSGSSSTTKKLHKRDRNGKEHSSSSSRSSSAHSGKLSSSSSTKKVSSSSSSSHKKDYVSGKSSSGSTTPVPSSKQQTHSSASSSYNNTNNSVAGDNKERADERRERDNNREQRSFDKERHHHRHRTTSSSNANNTVTQSQAPAVASSTTTPTPPPPPASKKRQLNFEQELTKDLPLVNAVTSSSSRHRKDSGSRDSRDDMLSSSCSSSSNSSLAARKRRESSSSSGGGSRHRHNSGSSCGGGVGVGAEQQKDALAAHKSAVAEHNGILAGAHVAPLPPPTYVREHVAIPHFNNVVVSGPPPPLMAAYFSGIGAVPGSSVDAPIATYVPTPALPPSSGSAPPTPHNHSLLKTLPMQPVLSHLAAAVHMQPTLPTLSSSSTGGNVAVLPPPTATVAPPAMHSPGAAASLLPCNSASANSTASTYNSIYGKLRDTSPVIVPPTLSAVTAALAAPAVTPVTGGIVGKTATATAAPAGVSANISLSEYLDTKVKSYSTTLGGYVTPAHTYAGGSVTPNVPSKATTNNTVSTSVASVENITTVSTPLESPVASKLPTPLKLPLTRTASHDPRLNPQLNAPEPPPAPKRKLSINEYRKRMQLSTDSTTPSTPEPPAAVSSTATTPAAHMTPASLNNSFVQAYNSIVNASPEEMARQLSASPTTLTLNKYTLNSPERKRRHSGSEKEQRHSVSYEDASGLLNSSTGSSSSCGNASDTSLTNLNHEDDGRKGQFSAAPTLLEKQQEKLCERLKLLRNMKKGVASLSSAASEFANLKKDCDLYVNRTNSISSTDNLDNCLEEISSSSSSSSSTSRASSREASPERSGVVSSSSNASVCKRATSTTGSNHKWLHEPETTTKAARGDTPTRDDVLLAATASRCGSESAT